jgi:cholesterol oxidase
VSEPDFDHDVLVIGSGFGGAVTALRLTEKGYRVAVLEAGRRFTPDTLPRTSWDARNFLWAPRLGMTGIQRLTLLKDVLILSGAGVGGGSLVYANTLYVPPAPFFTDRQWAHITDWHDELTPYYDQAQRMLGVTETPFTTPADDIMREIAEEMGVGDTYRPTPVGVFFGDEPGRTVPDPYFGGAGPDKTGCIRCGSCMTGCRHGAKNSLDTNYLHLAEGAGASILPEHEVTDIRPLPGGGFEVHSRRPGVRPRTNPVRTAEQVVVSASALGTQKLLHRLRDEGSLPNLSPRLGQLSRTNSEAILGAQGRRVTVDHSKGIAITSSFHPDEHTHVEPVRYGRGSNAMGLLATVMVDGGGRIPRWLRFVLTVLAHPIVFLRSLSVRRWSERSIIVLVMQSLDNSLDVRRVRGAFGRWKLTSEQGHGEPNPTWIPVGNEVTRKVAARIDGEAGSALNEAVLDVPTTAHFIGGCPIGDSPETGVIDPYQRVYGHPGLHVADGSAITANLGVNPSLTITAMTERAMALWPNRGEPDPRPPLGAPYERIEPVAPRRPVVPVHAPGALRLPIVDVS